MCIYMYMPSLELIFTRWKFSGSLYTQILSNYFYFTHTVNFSSSLSSYICLMHQHFFSLYAWNPSVHNFDHTWQKSEPSKFKNTCVKHHTASCFLAVFLKVIQYFVFSTTWHSMTKQSSYLLYLSALLYQLQMMKCFSVCCCFFPLGACTDFFQVLCVSNKWFIYYLWHLNLLI